MKLHAISALLLVAGYCTTPAHAGWFGSSSDQPDPAAQAAGQAPPAKFDYKQSFKKPYLYNGTVPFWNAGGGKFAADSHD